MYPEALAEQFPTIAAAMGAMLIGQQTGTHDQEWANTITGELQRHPKDDASFNLVFDVIWLALEESQEQFLERTGRAFSYFGVNDEVRVFIGSLWAAAFRRWPIAAQEEFFRRMGVRENLDRDLALEFMPPAFREARVVPECLHAWIRAVRQARGGRYPRQISQCLETYAKFKQRDALRLIDLWLRVPLDDATRTLAAQTLHWVRESAGTAEAEARLLIDKVENVLGAKGESSHRVLLLESWAFSAASPALDEAKAIKLRDNLVQDSLEEVRSWCFLLYRVVVMAPEKLSWAFRELRMLAKPTLGPESRYWLGMAALDGWKMADSKSPLGRDDWEALFFQMAPLDETDGGLWQQLEHFFVDAYRIDPTRAERVLVRVAETSGQTWDALLEKNHDAFVWLCQSLQAAGRAEGTVSTLCLARTRAARRVGIRMFERCGLTGLSAKDIAGADAVQIERILLESTVKIGEYDHLALLHVSVAHRVDQIGGALAERFYDEVLTQALNTNQYRQIIQASAGDHAKLRACIGEAERRIEKSAKASKSPALKMHIPGHRMAEMVAMRRLSRVVSESVEKNSIFAQLVTTVPLLYGRAWRMQHKGGYISAASELKLSEVSTEMPRLEFMTPEAMRHRRLMAARRIAELDRAEGDET